MRQTILSFVLLVALALAPTILKSGALADTDEETVVWNSVKSSGNAELLRAFIDTYPNGKFTRIAESLINVLEGDVPAKTLSLDASTEETDLWNKAKATGNQADVQRYLDTYPNGRYAALARQRLSFLSNPPAETASASQDTIENTATTVGGNAAVVEPESTQTAALHPFDGQWRLTGRANSFKKYAGGFCQNPNSINARLVVADGRIDTKVRSKNSNTAELEGRIDAGGQLDLSITSYFSGWDMFGKTSVKLRKGGGTTRFTVTLKDAGSSGCNYDFSLKRLN